ncbi:MAG: hypothetical protein ACP5C3_05015 [Methanomicrobiales archaeon]
MSLSHIPLKAGATVECNGKKGVLGAIIFYKNKICALSVYHLIRAAGCSLNSKVSLNGIKGSVLEILMDLDLVIIETNLRKKEVELSQLDQPQIGSAYALNGTKKNICRILTVGKTYHYLSFPHRKLPLPGDSGSPIIQNEKVVGILSSVFFNNAAGIAVSIERFI